MTKRIIGLILAIAAIAVIVIAAIRHNTYTSMIGPAATEMPAPEKNGAKKTGAGNSAARFAHCGQTRHGTANGRPCRAGTVIENNLTIGIFPFGGNGRTHGFGHAIRLLHIPREKASVKFPDRNPRHSESVPGISTRRISLFQQNATAPSSARELRPHRSRR